MKTEWDAQVKGLHLRVRPSGHAAYYILYRTRQGVQRRPKLGDASAMTLNDARRVAKAILERVALGQDPKGEWDAEKAEINISALFELVWKKHWSKPRFITSGWAREADRNFKNHILPTFGAQKIQQVRAVDIRNWHEGLSKTPYAANRSLEVLSKMFQFAIDYELMPQNSNPCKLVKAHVERKRGRYATKEEIKRICDALEANKDKDPRGVAFLYCLLLSGARPSALAKAIWGQCEIIRGPDEQKYGCLHYDGKSSASSGIKERVIIPEAAMRIIERLPRFRETDKIFGVFPKALWEKIRTTAQCPDLWARDLRRTFATLALSNGVSLDTIGEMLNHQSIQTTKIYGKLMEEERLKASQTVSDSIAKILERKIA